MNGSKREVDEYLRGNSDVSRAYRQLKSPRVPAGIDQAIADHARDAVSEPANDAEHASAPRRRMRDINQPIIRQPSWFAPLSAAASVILCAAVLLTIAFDPHTRSHKDDKIRMVPAVARHELGQRQLYSSDPPNSRTRSVDGALLPPMPITILSRKPQEWLAHIDTQRRAGQAEAAAAELREFHNVFPNYPVPAALQSFR